MNTEPSLHVVELDPKTTTTFTANGHVYHVEREARLSVMRDRYFEKFSTYSILGRSGQTFLKEVRAAYDANNASKPGDVAVKLDNLMKGAADMEAKYGPLYYVCTLFINREDEDRKSYDMELAARKLEDWSALPADFFLACASGYLSGTQLRFDQIIQSFSGLTLPDLTLKSPVEPVSFPKPSEAKL